MQFTGSTEIVNRDWKCKNNLEFPALQNVTSRMLMMPQ